MFEIEAVNSEFRGNTMADQDDTVILTPEEKAKILNEVPDKDKKEDKKDEDDD